MVEARITHPNFTGGRYDGAADIHPLMAGSMEMYSVCTIIPNGCGGIWDITCVSQPKSWGCGIPLGRRRSIIRWLRNTDSSWLFWDFIMLSVERNEHKLRCCDVVDVWRTMSCCLLLLEGPLSRESCYSCLLSVLVCLPSTYPLPNPHTTDWPLPISLWATSMSSSIRTERGNGWITSPISIVSNSQLNINISSKVNVQVMTWKSITDLVTTTITTINSSQLKNKTLLQIVFLFLGYQDFEKMVSSFVLFWISLGTVFELNYYKYIEKY